MQTGSQLQSLRGYCNSFGYGFCGVANRIQVSHDLARLARIFIVQVMPGHLPNSVGVIRDRSVESIATLLPVWLSIPMPTIATA